jgi:hypothetical protein
MSEAPPNTETPPETGAPNSPNAPENPNPQEPNVTPNPAAPSNPSPAPSPSTTEGNQPDLLAEIRALPERFAHVLSEKNPTPSQQSTQTPAQNSEPAGPNGKGDSWESRFARMWFGN